jgi:hypothetical protein
MTAALTPQAEAAAWNLRHRPGTAVHVTRDDGTDFLTTTRSEAEVLGGHTAVVWLNGASGCFLLDRCSPVNDAPGS